MVAGMMKKWRPWPPISCKKVEAKIIVNQMEGFCVSDKKMDQDLTANRRLSVEVRWKGSKGNALRALRRSVRRNFTKEEALSEDGTVKWNEEFISACNFLGQKEEGSFHPWEVAFTVFKGCNGGGRGSKNKVEIVANASFNLAEFAPQTELDIKIPLTVSSSSMVGCNPILCLSLNLLELRAASSLEVPPNTIMPVPFSPSSDEALPARKPESSAFKVGMMKKVKIFTCYGEDGSVQNDDDDNEIVDPFDTESLDNDQEDEVANDNSNLQIASNCRPLAYKNVAEDLFYSNASHVAADLVYYSNRRSETVSTSVNESLWMIPRRRLLLWRKRKLSFKSPAIEGEPLLKKQFAEEGGDDIDFDRRQLTSSHESSFMPDGLPHNEFGDDYFAVGRWEDKEVISRDGQLKLQTQVFFASIDQMSEKAAGESACTVLVAVIADWFQSNHNQMPIKSQLDGLIREGSLEWRNLCENETYRERFPDRHFDLDTVLEAKIRPLRVVPEKSFIGFFHPEGIEEEEGKFDFLDGAMSFDAIWQEINSHAIDDGEHRVYVISWNDHFFLLKVDNNAYYILDTLGERLHEGCNQAYVLKFDKDTKIVSLPAKETESQQNVETEDSKSGEESENSKPVEEERIVCSGKESCGEYIKCFLAAIPIRELQVDIKKGLMSSTPLHHRLQIEFHLTEQDLTLVQSSSTVEAIGEPLALSGEEVSGEEMSGEEVSRKV
ncbi:uncharacterized protein LOC124926346 isoform X2 [Impatiens glandulifera]|uniref:uncharacterized protein LOC124926346 isoform X2 n=1 Tax=Impatiens glandulifera TaxID=253017 RepID=UPI001FB147D2|nr:uncharacterized protein LOC124926346 isoform X2 [Impatiens glandulifera]